MDVKENTVVEANSLVPLNDETNSKKLDDFINSDLVTFLDGYIDESNNFKIPIAPSVNVVTKTDKNVIKFEDLYTPVVFAHLGEQIDACLFDTIQPGKDIEGNKFTNKPDLAFYPRGNKSNIVRLSEAKLLESNATENEFNKCLTGATGQLFVYSLNIAKADRETEKTYYGATKRSRSFITYTVIHSKKVFDEPYLLEAYQRSASVANMTPYEIFKKYGIYIKSELVRFNYDPQDYKEWFEKKDNVDVVKENLTIFNKTYFGHVPVRTLTTTILDKGRYRYSLNIKDAYSFLTPQSYFELYLISNVRCPVPFHKGMNSFDEETKYGIFKGMVGNILANDTYSFHKNTAEIAMIDSITTKIEADGQITFITGSGTVYNAQNTVEIYYVLYFILLEVKDYVNNKKLDYRKNVHLKKYDSNEKDGLVLDEIREILKDHFDEHNMDKLNKFIDAVETIDATIIVDSQENLERIIKNSNINMKHNKNNLKLADYQREQTVLADQSANFRINGKKVFVETSGGPLGHLSSTSGKKIHVSSIVHHLGATDIDYFSKTKTMEKFSNLDISEDASIPKSKITKLNKLFEKTTVDVETRKKYEKKLHNAEEELMDESLTPLEIEVARETVARYKDALDNVDTLAQKLTKDAYKTLGELYKFIGVVETLAEDDKFNKLIQKLVLEKDKNKSDSTNTELAVLRFVPIVDNLMKMSITKDSVLWKEEHFGSAITLIAKFADMLLSEYTFKDGSTVNLYTLNKISKNTALYDVDSMCDDAEETKKEIIKIIIDGILEIEKIANESKLYV